MSAHSSAGTTLSETGESAALRVTRQGPNVTSALRRRDGFLPPADLSAITDCGFLMPSGVTCGKPARASVDGPRGEHVSLCATHAASAARYITDSRWREWRLRP